MAIAKAKERSTYVQKSRLEGDERIVVDGQHFVTPNQIIAPVKRNAYSDISRRSPGFYRADYDSLDEEYAREYFEHRAPVPNVGGCSVVAHGGLVGRNLDWPKHHPDGSVDAVFEVHTSAAQGRYASFGFAGSLADLSIDAVESRQYSDAYKLLPYYLQDGLNEQGLFAAILVVPATASRVTVPEIDRRDRVCSIALVRWILDHYRSVYEAVADLRNYVEIFHPVGLTAMGYEPHFFLKDSTKSVVLELAGTGLVAIEINACTNFHLQGVSFNADGTVWTNADVLDGHYPSSQGIEVYGSGLERFNALVTANPEDKEGMRALLDSVLFSKAYTLQTGVWYSEFVGGSITVDTPANAPALQARLADYRQKYADDDSDVWITKQSVIYDLMAGSASLTVFEGEDEYMAVLSQEGDFATIDFVERRVSDFVTKSVNDLVNYYHKSETYSRTEVQTLIDAVKQFTYEVVSSLPAAAAVTMHKIYLVPSADPKAQNIKEEYITIDNGAGADTRYTWEKIGSTAIDLSNYPTIAQMTAAINAALGDYTTTAALTLLLAGKQDVIDADHKLPYSLLSGVPDLSGFVTRSVNDLVNYYLKSETYTKSEVQALVDAVKQFTYEVVASLPAAAAGTMHKIYLVPSADPKAQNIKEEYITIDNGAGAETRYTWEQIGSTAIDLSNYPTTVQMTAAINTALGDYTTTTALTTLLAGKADKSELTDLESEVGELENPTVASSVPTGGMLPETLYELGTLSGAVSLPHAAGVTGKRNHYFYTFETGATVPTITWDSTITKWYCPFNIAQSGAVTDAPFLSANKHYEVSVIAGYAAVMEV